MIQIAFQLMPSEDDLYQQHNINKKQIEKDISEAVRNIVRERFKLAAKSVFRPLSNKCLYLNFDKAEKTYLHFKLYPKTDAFPWDDDYNELNITRLNNFASLEITYLDRPPTKVIKIGIFGVNIRWDYLSTKTSQLNFNIERIDLMTRINMPNDYANINFESITHGTEDGYIETEKYDGRGYIYEPASSNAHNGIYIKLWNIERSDDETIEVEDEVRKKLAKLIMNGLEQAFQSKYL